MCEPSHLEASQYEDTGIGELETRETGQKALEVAGRVDREAVDRSKEVVGRCEVDMLDLPVAAGPGPDILHQEQDADECPFGIPSPLPETDPGVNNRPENLSRLLGNSSIPHRIQLATEQGVRIL